jgi:tyrosyl-tRNA synthetase
MTNAVDVLKERGFVEQTTHDEELHELFENETVTCYIGFDPTASSLHIGSLVPIMSLAHMQRCGHRPIALVGGGTGLVGDPSGKTEMRKLLTAADVEINARGIKSQLSRFIDFSNEKALMLNNAEWLTQLNYIEFLRDIGRHFSVNRMLKAESYRMRLESEEGLNFIEFNYMLLQAYDFLELFDRHQCRLQMGGSDQWGNIVAGIELVRRIAQGSVYGITFPLITTSGGAKMGKTASGAVWLDPDRTSPYDYYQYWINTDDRDVERFLALFTFLPLKEIRLVTNLKSEELNQAKIVLAFEATRLAHGNEAAAAAWQKTSELFGRRELSSQILPSSGIHTVLANPAAEIGPTSDIDNAVFDSEIEINELLDGIPAFKLFHNVGLAKSGGAARRLIEQGGAYVNADRIGDVERLITAEDADADGVLVLRSGKKRYHKIRIKK